VLALVRIGATSILPRWWVNLALVMAIVGGGIAIAAGFLGGELGIVTMGAVLLIGLPAMEIVHRRIQWRYRRTAKANGWSLD
jgi:hypothetical protein